MSKSIKEIWEGVKAAFNTPVPAPAPAPPAPAPTPAPAAMAAKTYKLHDGTEISISQAGELPAVGDLVTIAGVPALANTYTLEDGATITVDATGAITVYTAAPAPPVPAPTPAPPPAPVTLSVMSAEDVAAMYAKFATGTPEERLANAEIMIKALMENSFGWKIREGNENQAIQVYKDTMTPTAPAPTVTIEQMNSAFAKADEQAKEIEKLNNTIKLLLDLTEKLVELPTADPVTLTGSKKEKFDAQNKKEERIAKMAAAVAEMKAEANKQ
jgi:hypothetical protein